jgi:hypothetical protein
MTDAKWLIKSPRLLFGDTEGRLNQVDGIAARHDLERAELNVVSVPVGNGFRPAKAFLIRF